MLVSYLVDEVKAVLRTENLPLTDDEIAKVIGRVAVKLTALVPLLPVIDHISTERKVSYSLPSDYTSIDRVVYRPAASAIITMIEIVPKRLTITPDAEQCNFDSRGVLMKVGTGERTAFRREGTKLVVDDISFLNVNDRIEEVKDEIELRIGSLTEPNTDLLGLYSPTTEPQVGLYGRFLRLSPDEKRGYLNLRLHAYITHPVIGSTNDVIILSRLCDPYLVYQSAYLILSQMMGEEAPALMEQLKREANEALKGILSSAPNLQTPATISITGRTYRNR